MGNEGIAIAAKRPPVLVVATFRAFVLLLWPHLLGKVSVLVQTASDSNMWEQRWPFGRSTKMHRLGANILILMVLIPTVYITWSIAASRFGLAPTTRP